MAFDPLVKEGLLTIATSRLHSV